MSSVSRHLLTEIPERYTASIDLFICAASFESRCLSVANQLSVGQVTAAIVCTNTGSSEDASLSIENEQALISKFNNSAIKVALPLNSPLAVADNLVAALDKVLLAKQIKNCLIDITSFTQESLLILLQVIARKIGSTGCDVNFIYTAASAYAPGKKIEDVWLSKSVSTVRSVLGYSGEFDPSKGLHLIILMGIEVEKVMKLITMLEPVKLSFGLPRRSSSVNLIHTKISELNYNKLAIARQSVKTFSFSCTSPNQTRLDLSEYISQFPDYNTIIAPQNTKLSTLGAGLYAMRNPEVQLCYAPAIQHNISNYSSPDNFCYIYSRKFKKPSGMIV